MIEVVYNANKKEPVGNEGFFDIPKNIRQIGQVEDDFKIYIEDYAYHYLDRMSDEVSGGRVALLLGKTNWADGVTYVFIKSAFKLEDVQGDLNHIPFNEEVWSHASVFMEDYFQEQEVVGWFFTMPECPMEMTEAMYRTHLNYFAGNDKVFFLMEPIDKEEAFYRYDNGKMNRQRGYYLYYERNDAMQEFMIDMNQNLPMESGEMVRDKAVKDFRQIIADKEKAREPEETKGGSTFMYASTAAAIILALALGTNYMNNYEKLQEVPKRVEEVTSQLEEGGEIAESKMPDVTETPSVTKMPDVTETPQTMETPVSTEMPIPAVTETVEEPVEEPVAKNVSIAQDTKTYEIKAGDTLTSISNAIYGNTEMVDAICQSNGITQDTVIYPGETILLP